MRVTVKGQVTIPQQIREKMGITKNKEVDFIEDNKGRIFLVVNNDSTDNKLKRLRGCATVKITTDEILAMTREG
jgi:AbrB family looped-hinge helix DNA binding protein